MMSPESIEYWSPRRSEFTPKGDHVGPDVSKLAENPIVDTVIPNPDSIQGKFYNTQLNTQPVLREDPGPLLKDPNRMNMPEQYDQKEWEDLNWGQGRDVIVTKI